MDIRSIEDIQKEFDKDFDNYKITNDTLKTKYLNSIIKKHLDQVDNKEEYQKLEKEIENKIKERIDFAKDIKEKLIQLEQDLKKGYRVHKTSRGEKVAICFTRFIDDEEVEILCSELYNKLIANTQYLTHDELARNLEKRGVWSKEKDKKIDKLRDSWMEITQDLTKEQIRDKPNMKTINDIAKRLEIIKEEYDELVELKNKHFNNTVESKVDEHRLRLRLLKSIYSIKETETEKGEKIEEPNKLLYADFDELSKESKVYIYELFELASAFWQGREPSLLPEAPEDESEGAEAKEVS